MDRVSSVQQAGMQHELMTQVIILPAQTDDPFASSPVLDALTLDASSPS